MLTAAVVLAMWVSGACFIQSPFAGVLLTEAQELPDSISAGDYLAFSGKLQGALFEAVKNVPSCDIGIEFFKESTVFTGAGKAGGQGFFFLRVQVPFNAIGTFSARIRVNGMVVPSSKTWSITGLSDSNQKK